MKRLFLVATLFLGGIAVASAQTEKSIDVNQNTQKVQKVDQKKAELRNSKDLKKANVRKEEVEKKASIQARDAKLERERKEKELKKQ